MKFFRFILPFSWWWRSQFCDHLNAAEKFAKNPRDWDKSGGELEAAAELMQKAYANGQNVSSELSDLKFVIYNVKTCGGMRRPSILKAENVVEEVEESLKNAARADREAEEWSNRPLKITG